MLAHLWPLLDLRLTTTRLVLRHPTDDELVALAGRALELGLFTDDRPVGMVAMRGREFSVRREVKTESWLGLAHHRQGLGTEARSARAVTTQLSDARNATDSH